MASRKQDWDSDRQHMQGKLIDLQSELQNLRATTRIQEERIKTLDSERNRVED